MNKLLAAFVVATFGLTPFAYAEHDGAGAHCKMHKKDHFTEADANKDGAIDKAESQAMHEKKFDKMDQDHDGKLSEDEAAACKREHKHQ